jgi:hypothetical protein
LQLARESAEFLSGDFSHKFILEYIGTLDFAGKEQFNSVVALAAWHSGHRRP